MDVRICEGPGIYEVTTYCRGQGGEVEERIDMAGDAETEWYAVIRAVFQIPVPAGPGKVALLPVSLVKWFRIPGATDLETAFAGADDAAKAGQEAEEKEARAAKPRIQVVGPRGLG